jgi:hypothetical protein
MGLTLFAFLSMSVLLKFNETEKKNPQRTTPNLFILDENKP